MTDFVTRLESELHAAALRQERRGRVGRAALPRLRVSLGDLPTAALAAAALGLVVAVSAVFLSLSPRQGTAGDLPPALQGAWRAAPTELRLYQAGAERCINLGLGSSDPCYALGEGATRIATDWGRLSLAGDDRMTLHSVQGAGTGTYSWRFTGEGLRLTSLNDRNTARAAALTTMPFTFVERPDSHPGVPTGWTIQPLGSKRFGYSLRVPHYWLIDATGPADRLSGSAATGRPFPEVTVAARPSGAGTSAPRCALHDSRSFPAAGMRVRVAVYRECGAPNLQSASFTHGGRDYRVTWRGNSTNPEDDYARFDAILKSVAFAG